MREAHMDVVRLTDFALCRLKPEVGVVAARLGWASVPTFHRAFTAFAGVTPGAWRQMRA
jgi:AraC-like DNA-binding protein